MVLYYESNTVDPPAVIYAGKDKYENEELIRYALPMDVWLHVDKYSSPHFYLRLPEGMDWEAIPEPLL
jgi:predicted ribosome quality control (RQC) complex YloA/Tae2 family protein